MVLGLALSVTEVGFRLGRRGRPGIAAAKLHAANDRTARLQEHLWFEAATVAAEDRYAITTGLFVAVILLIVDLDLDRPRRGLIQVGQQGLVDLRDSLRGTPP